MLSHSQFIDFSKTLFAMQGCMAGKSGEVTPEKLWEKAKELEKKDVG